MATLTLEPPIAEEQVQAEARRPAGGTIADWLDHFAEVPADRIVADPAPGTVTYEDYVKIDGRAGAWLVELVDNTLIRKAVGKREGRIGMTIGGYLFTFIRGNGLGGKLCGSDGMGQMSGGNIRMPDVSWTAPEDVTDPNEELAAPKEPPTLAVEVVSAGNTEREMKVKLGEYFASGCRLAWIVYPDDRRVEVYTSPTDRRDLAASETLDGGDVLPGFAVKVEDLFR